MIDTSTWKKYILGDLFDMQRGTGYGLKDLVEGNTPLISATTKNNSIVAYANVTPKFDAETITITTDGAGMGYATVQMKPFDIASNAVAVLPYDNNVGLYAKFFVCAVIRQYANRFSYKDKMNRDQLLQLEVYLPATSDGQPDWNYMESYMKAVMEESEKSLENLKKADDTKHLIDVSEWGEFRVGDLFDIQKGSRLTKANMKDGNIKYVGASAINNGETHRIANTEKLHKANVITVCFNGNVGATFYQDEIFWASDDLNVLYPNFLMTKNIALFICPIIESIGQKYSFVNKWKQEDMKNEYIKLPSTSDGQPDWQYIENYMKNIMNKSEQIISNLQIGA